jgi:hypothetical protein
VNYPSASFVSECAAAEEHWQAGRLAVLCDLSNCARTGDLLVFSGDRHLVVTEVKEAARSRGARQAEATRVKVEYLNSGRSTELTAAPLLKATRAPALKTHLSVLRDLFIAARSNAFGFGRAGEALAVSVIHGTGFSDESAARVVNRRASFEARLGWRPTDTYEFDSIARLRRDAKDAPASIAPFSIFPLPAETCAALSLGFAAYRTVLNLAKLQRALERRGLRVELPERFERSHTFLRVSSGTVTLLVRPAHAEHLLVELVSVGSFARMIETAMAAGETEDSPEFNIATEWSGEERVWR